MAEEPRQALFKSAASETLNMQEALTRSREALALVTPAPIDAVSSCQKTVDGTWKVTFDVIESAARMGDNDLLSAYELTLSPTGDLVNLVRVARYHREDRVS